MERSKAVKIARGFVSRNYKTLNDYAARCGYVYATDGRMAIRIKSDGEMHNEAGYPIASLDRYFESAKNFDVLDGFNETAFSKAADQILRDKKAEFVADAKRALDAVILVECPCCRKEFRMDRDTTEVVDDDEYYECEREAGGADFYNLRCVADVRFGETSLKVNMNLVDMLRRVVGEDAVWRHGFLGEKRALSVSCGDVEAIVMSMVDDAPFDFAINLNKREVFK